MLLHYYTHSLLFYLSLPTFQSNRDLNKKLQSIDYEYLPQEVCVAQCLERRKANNIISPTIKQIHRSSRDIATNWSLKICLDNCTSTNATNHSERSKLPFPKQIHENYSLNLVCRDDSSLNFNINLYTSNKGLKLDGNQSTDIEATTSSYIDAAGNLNEPKSKGFETLFVIKMHLWNNSDEIVSYLSDENFFTLDKLMANTTYNISVLAVHSHNKYSVIAQQQQFKTLVRSYTPGNVTEIKITHFTEDKMNKMHLTASMTWKPAADMTCHYDIICFSPESEDYDLHPLEIRNPRQLYKHQLENLTFSSVYKVGIRASNTKNMRESGLFWKTFSVPSCVVWHNYNFNICAPEAPQNLQVDQIALDEHIYSLNVSWLLPTHLPDNYTLRIQDLSLQGKTTVYELSKDIHNIFIPQITFYGVFYEVSLSAYTRGGYTTSSLTDVIKTVVHIPEKNPFVKLIAVILAPIFCVAILSLTIFIIYHRRAKLKRYQKRCKYFEELEKKAPIDPNNTFDFAENLKSNPNGLICQAEAPENMLFDDDMEIDRNDLILYQVLGEGAFGLVKLGLYKDNKVGTTQEVAVKMLKDHPSADDIYAFRREIEVMKSVEKHPNIVGIIGHCTRFSNDMMLVTEYCSFGNLLNFLRDEWHFLHELQIKRQNLSEKIAYIELNQGDTSSQESSPQMPSRYSINNSTESVDGHSPIYKQQLDDIDRVNDLRSDSEDNDDDDDIIERFKTKYNEINAVSSTTSGINKYNDNDTSEHKSMFQRVEDLNETDMEVPTTTNTNSSSLPPATENKSYGYHGFCTNSCKCNVDVIITNINSTDTDKQNEKLDRILAQQQQQQDIKLLRTNCSDTTIDIKNCDCKSKDQNHDNFKKLNGAVENKSYFSIFKSSKPQEKAASHKIKTKTKLKAPKPPKTLPNGSDDNKVVEVNHFSRVPLSCGDLLNIARQVAVGMEFLSKNKVVHRDLAARNVLVAPDRTVKIADFGLSRDVYQENMYKKTGSGKLPIKWLALESMTHQVYTTQSDVWSYGILLYEIITLGATPYPSISTNRLLHLLKSGYRMEKPKGCSEEFYDLMYSCWNAEPIERPTFNGIIEKLDEMLHFLEDSRDAPTIYSEVDKDLSIKQESIQNVSSDESYLKPL
ncbi:tyrosine-protein kinase receptor torso [Calliphora vicina]|uniref:tyrosine-protein kinase receptor torso n=1 Tax=Calliphora vicina TaxID=7373 RepID=UPI00325B2CFB